MEYLIFYLVCWIVAVNAINGILYYKHLIKSDKLYWFQLIPLAIGAAQSAMQYNESKKQKQESEKALKFRNSYVDTSAELAKTESNTSRYTGQDVDESNVRQGVADTFSNITRSTRSSGDILNAASRLSGQQQREYQNIAKGSQVFRKGAMDRYRQSLMQQAGVQEQNRQYSENLKGASSQNKYNAVNSVLGGVAATDWESLFNKGGSNGGYSWGGGTPGYNSAKQTYNWGF